MARRIDPRIFNHVIDTNVLHRLGDEHDEAVDEMLRLWRGGEISLVLPYSLKAYAARIKVEL